MLDLARGVGGALGQGADFVGHHGKAAALVAGTGRFDGSVECQQVGLFGNRADGAEDLVDTAAAGLQLDHGLGRFAQAAAQAVDVVGGRFDLLFTLGHAAVAILGGFGCAAAGAGDFVGGGHHFIECSGHQFYRLALATGSLVHVVGHLAVDLRSVMQIGRGRADVLDQLANGREKLVEPAGQFGGFVLAVYPQLMAQVAFALGNRLQAGADLADRLDDHFGERCGDQAENQHQHADDDGGEVGHARGLGHHFAFFDQADITPAQAGGGPHVGHVAHAVDLHFGGALRGLRQLRVGRTQVLQRFEVVGGVPWVDQHHAVLDQHHVTAVAELDALDQFGQVLQRHADYEYPFGFASAVEHGARGAYQGHVVFIVVIGRRAHGLAGAGHRRFVPGACARVVFGQLRIVRPFGVGAVFQADGQDRRRRVGGAIAGEALDHRLRFGGQRLSGRVGGLVIF